MRNSGQIYTVHEKLEAAEPSARVEMVREGFSFWAFVLTVFWLVGNRLWLAAAGYLALVTVMALAGEALALNPISMGCVQLLLQVLLGAHAHDLQRHKLAAQGYREAVVIVADSWLSAQQRYYAHIG